MSGRLHLTPAFFSDVHLSLVKLEICCYFVLSLQGWDVSFSLLHGLFRQILKKPKQAHTGPRPRTSHPEKRESSGHVTANLSHLVDMSEFKCWTHCNWWVFMLSLWRKYGNRQFLCAEIRPHLYNKVRTWTPSWRSIGNVFKRFRNSLEELTTKSAIVCWHNAASVSLGMVNFYLLLFLLHVF